MIWLGLVLFWLVDGMVRGNTAPEAAPIRAGLIGCLVIAWLVGLWKYKVRVPVIAAGFVGILAAMAVAEAYQRPTGGGIGTFILYAGVWWGQNVIGRDWSRDFSLAGVVVATLVLVAGLAGGPPPGGMFNRNMVAAFLAVLIPSMWGRLPWVAGVAAVMVTGCRGAMLAVVVTCLVMAWDRFGKKYRLWILATVLILAILLVVIRVATIEARLICLIEVLRQWWDHGHLFGLGPNFEMILSWGEHADNAHSVLPTLLAQTGLAGAMIIGLAMGLGQYRQWEKIPRWELATLAAFATLAIFENVTAWWPVGIVAALAAGTWQSVNWVEWE